MKAIEAGIITVTTRQRLLELEASAARLTNAIRLEEASLTHIERDQVIYWMEKFRDGDVNSQEFRRKIIQTFVAAVYLTDDGLRIVFNYSGKHNEVNMALVMGAEDLAGPGCSYSIPNGSPDEQRLQIRTISVRFAASVSLFLAGFERFAVQFRNQKTDQFQDRNVEMFYFRTPVVVFLV